MHTFLSGWSGTARRLTLGLGALALVVGLASWVALAGLHSTHLAVGRMKEDEEGMRLALELASAVRDQYAHQAHTIIIGNESHMGHYEGAREHVHELTRDLRAHYRGEEESQWMTEIEKAGESLDSLFRESIVPAVLRRDVAIIQSEHDRAQELVSLIQDRANRITEKSEASIRASRAEVLAAEESIHRWVMVLLIGAPILAIAIVLSVGRSIAGPLGRLRAGAMRLASGDLDTRIDVGTDDEFGALARQFNSMTVALKENQERLVQSEKLAGIGRLAAGVAHEINNPLAVILGYSRLLGKGASGPLADDARVIEEEAIRARDIVEGLLDLSRPLSQAREALNLREICEEVVGRLRDAGGLGGVEVVVEGEATGQGHPLKIRQVLTNLIRNAAEAAGAKGRVTIRVRDDIQGARVDVEDDGPGLAEHAASRLFEPFFTTKDKGTGLGLAVSRAIARAHGGDITLSPSPGQGAIFTLTLPLHMQSQEVPG
jgi:two-component system, NtrC family, sensor kinase